MRLLLLWISLILLPGSAAAERIMVAAAANFADPLAEIAASFEAETGHDVVIVIGSSGKLYAQIINGAPFDLFLSADAARPARLEAEGRILPGTRIPYAFGRLALWSADPALVTGPEALDEGRIAIANPKLAPYGAAAIEVLAALEIAEDVETRIVQGENVGQAFAMVASGNARTGFVALAQLRGPRAPGGAFWVVPAEMHAPIRQDAVLLRDTPAARAFHAFLQGPEAEAILERFGYDLGAE